MHEQRYAFFDLDRTITRADTSFAFLRMWAKRHTKGIGIFGAAGRFFATPFVLALWKLGVIRSRTVKNFFFSVVRGCSAGYVDAAARAFVEESFERLVKPDALVYIEALRPQYCLVLVSASPEFYARYFAKRLGFSLYAATRYAVSDGVYTGRMEGEDCRDEGKVRRVAELISLDAYDRAHSLAFSDDLRADGPLLTLAGNAFHTHKTKWRLTPLSGNEAGGATEPFCIGGSGKRRSAPVPARGDVPPAHAKHSLSPAAPQRYIYANRESMIYRREYTWTE